MFCNAYAFTPDGRRLILGLGLSLSEAAIICETQTEYMPRLQRYAGLWLDDDGLPRLTIFNADHDPFATDNKGAKWVEWVEL